MPTRASKVQDSETKSQRSGYFSLPCEFRVGECRVLLALAALTEDRGVN